jgi:hypothetical protein
MGGDAQWWWVRELRTLPVFTRLRAFWHIRGHSRGAVVMNECAVCQQRACYIL